jgi:Fe-S-cluster containining protein
MNRWIELGREVAEGLLYTHTRLNANSTKTLEATAFLYALIELLDEKGIVKIEELDERKRIVGQRLVEQLRRNGNGVVLQDSTEDKYDFAGVVAIDCRSRLSVCQAACCRLPFALSKQDLAEGIIQWNLGQPYWIAQNEGNYCCHLNRDGYSCTVYENRPLACRGFDCRQNTNIWLDFDRMIVNPGIYREGWPQGTIPDASQRSEP